MCVYQIIAIIKSSYLVFGLVPGLELGLLELEPESLLLCLGPTPAVTLALGSVELPRPGE